MLPLVEAGEDAAQDAHETPTDSNGSRTVHAASHRSPRATTPNHAEPGRPRRTDLEAGLGQSVVVAQDPGGYVALENHVPPGHTHIVSECFDEVHNRRRNLVVVLHDQDVDRFG